MSASPYSYSTMEPTLGSTVCLICFEMTEKHIFVPADAPQKLFMNCNKYLHSTLTKETPKDIKLHNENQVPLCKSCFDSALELTQLSEQLASIEKDISDLTVAFSMTVFHRRSQVYSIGQSCKTSSIVEFNEACLPPNLFSKNLGDQNIHPNKTNQEIDINDLHLQTEISNVNSFIDIPSSGNPHSSVANGAKEIQYNEENLVEQCRQSTIKQNQNFESVSEMKIGDATGDANDSKKRANPNNGMRLTTSDLLKSVKMPKIILERIKIDGYMLNVSVGNSSETNCESPQKNLDETLFNDHEFSVPSCVQKSPEDGKLPTCFSSENTFPQVSRRTLLHKTHTGETICKRPLDKRKYVFESNQKICQITPTGKNTFYKCSYCEKTFSRTNSLLVHERIHTGEKPYKCSFCNKRCSDTTSLRCHERTHTGERPFKCSFCNNRFSQISSLKRHEKTHKSEKSFKCSFCNTRFSHLSNLKIHERSHTGEQPFKCSFCGTGFNQLGNLKAHERTHTGEKPFKCSFCNARFTQKGNLKDHEKIHSGEKPFKCSVCGTRFNRKGNLKIHERTHTGEKPFKCSFCNHRFYQLGGLKRHEKTHTGEKPFKCSYCEQSFPEKYYLKVHQRLHHMPGDKPYNCLHCKKTFSQTSDTNSHQKCDQEKEPTLISQVGNQKEDSLKQLKHQEKINSVGLMEFKCSFCEMTFNHGEESANHEKIHRREDEIVNENLIVGI